MKIRSWAEIHTNILRTNAEKVFKFSKKGIIAVVKADAYGHDAKIVSKELEKLSFIKFLAVATAEEGKQLREEGIKKDILVLGGILEDEVECFNQYNLTPVISDFYSLNLVRKLKDKKVHLKFDTGMHRLGFYETEIENLKSFLLENKIKVEGLMSHFPSADVEPDFTKGQIKKFREIVESLKIFKPKHIHLQNSAGLDYKCDYCNLVRVGLVLYGEKPKENFPIDVQNCMFVKARLISKKRLRKGERVSYCGSFKAKNDMEIGVISFGYADGLPRSLSNRGYILINGKKAYIIGNITMDMTIVDLTGIDAKIGDEVVIVGNQKGECINFSDIAKIAGTIPYEIMCGISKRVKRVKV